MFTKVRYVDPKLYLPNGQPDCNEKLSPSDWVSLARLIKDVELEGQSSNSVSLVVPSGDGSSIANAIYFNSVNGTNTIVCTREDGQGSLFYRCTFEPGTYSFSRTNMDYDDKLWLLDSNGNVLMEDDDDLYSEYTFSEKTTAYVEINYYSRETYGGSTTITISPMPSDEGGTPPSGGRFSAGYRFDNEFFNYDGNLSCDTVFGAKLNGYLSRPKNSGEGKTIDDPVYFTDEQSNGSVTFISSSSFPTKFYKFLLEAGITYTFSRTTNYDDQVWYYNEDGSYDGINRDGTGSFTKRFDKDTFGYLEVGGYNRDRYGSTTFSISPIPKEEIVCLSDFVHIESSNSNIVFGQNSFTYSIWVYEDGAPLNGSVFSLSKNKSVKLCLYIDNRDVFLHNFYNGNNDSKIYEIPSSSFNKRGLKSPVNIILEYDFDFGWCYVYIDGVAAYSEQVSVDTDCDSLMIGDSYLFNNDNFCFNGSLKWFRAYDRALSQQEVLSLSSEFDHRGGDGVSTTYPLGMIPKNLEENTAYVIRKYQDGTPTYLNLSGTDIASVGFFGCPQTTERVFVKLPDEVQDCEWIGELGRVLLTPLTNDYQLNNSTISEFYMNDVELIRNPYGTNPMFRFGISSDSSKFVFEKCRFSSVDCNIDDSNSTSWNNGAGRYFLFTGTIGEFIMRDSVVVNTNVYYDAFQIVNCRKATIRNVDIYSTTSSENYNGFCFGFINGITSQGASQYTYSNYYDYISGSSTGMIDIKNVSMKLRCNAGTYSPGLILSVSCKRLRMDNISIENMDDISNSNSSILAYNGMIVIRGTYDYNVNNVNVSLSNMYKVTYNPVVLFGVSEPSRGQSYTHGKEEYHSIKNVNITIGDDSSKASPENQRNYFYNSTEETYFPLYSVFCVYSASNPSHSIHLVKDCSVYAPRSTAVALYGVRGSFNNINGIVRLDQSHIDIKNLSSIFGYNVIDLWYNGEANIENLSIANPTDDNLIKYNADSSGYTNSHVYVKNSNCQIQRLSFTRNGNGDNNAIIYCPNTKVTNGFFLRGMANMIIPVDIRRAGGHGVSLRLAGYREQEKEFRFPPLPYDGISYILLPGTNKMTVYFAEAEIGHSYSEWVENNLWIELETSETLYDSRFDGRWYQDNSDWGSPLLSPFKYVISFNLEQEEKVYVRVYYNVKTMPNGGLFMDPKIVWE